MPGEQPRDGDYGGLTFEAGTGVVTKAAATAPGTTSRDGEATFTGPETSPQTTKATIGPCDGNNTGADYLDSFLMGGPLVGIRWIPAASQTITRIEVFTGEVAAVNALAIWSHDALLDQPAATLAATANFTTITANGWQGAELTSPVSVTGGQVYWIVWDPSGNEQASITDDPLGIQQTYWGSYSGDVNGGASWFGPFSHSNHRWKFRLFCGAIPCDGNNYANDDHRDNVSTSQAVQAISWIPTVSATISRLEFYTGEDTGPDAVGIWSNDPNVVPNKPLAPLGYSNPFPLNTAKGWQGADLLTPVTVTAGQLYWVVWQTSGGEQTPVNDDLADIQQTYWGDFSGSVSSANFTNGPFSFSNMRWKFRVFCTDADSYCDGNNYGDDLHRDNVSMGGGMVAIRWQPAANNLITGIEVYTGEATGPSILSVWSDAAGQPGTQLATTLGFATTLAKGWQGAALTSPLAVTGGQTYWVGWNNSGGEQASVSSDPGGLVQPYWGSWTNGASWYGPFVHWAWKFRMSCGEKEPCEGNNYQNDNYLDNSFAGGALLGIRWVPTSSVTVSRVEVFTGETTATNTIAIWSSTGGLNPEPDTVIGGTASFTVALGNGWQGADLPVPVPVTAGQEYWVVWDPVWQQLPVTDDPADIQQIYRGSWDGGNSWTGPWSFTDRRWKFRMFCDGKEGCGPGICIESSYCDDCQCYAPSSPVSIAFCRCRLADPGCGLGECVSTPSGPVYCEGPYCGAPVCYLPTSPISLLLCGGGLTGCG
ncbi:MAG: DUF4082 domain-containing protein [Thermoanaerobaculia bacterium]|nr:DUF4082 domain-containing protein [Thermoanaerobaculia bacterium]